MPPILLFLLMFVTRRILCLPLSNTSQLHLLAKETPWNVTEPGLLSLPNGACALFRNEWCLRERGTWLGVFWWLLEENCCPAAPVCDDCLLAVGVPLISESCKRCGSQRRPLTFLTTLKVNMCETARLSTSDCFLSPAVFSIFFHFSFSPDSDVPRKVLAALLGLFNGQNMQSEMLLICHLCEVCVCWSSHLMLNDVYMLLTH